VKVEEEKKWVVHDIYLSEIEEIQSRLQKSKDLIKLLQ
jgi:hypothetical protein